MPSVLVQTRLINVSTALIDLRFEIDAAELGTTTLRALLLQFVLLLSLLLV